MIYLHFLFTVWLFSWYSDKLINDVSGIDQYWHIPQLLFLIAVYVMPVWVTENKVKYSLKLLGMGLMFPFLFNTLLNTYRHLPISYVGKYDFLPFWAILTIFIIGLLWTLSYNFYRLIIKLISEQR